MREPVKLMRLAVVGSREFPRLDLISDSIRSFGRCIIVSGGAKGVDREAERVANELGFPTEICHADWNNEGIEAGKIRNRAIVDRCDALLIFWDGKSPGTKHTLDLAMIEQRPLILTTVDECGKISMVQRNWH